MVDSDKHTYATAENGDLLSLKEMREKIIKQEPVNFDSFMDDSISEKNHLYYYWAKNLYYFDAIETQTYNIESDQSGSYRKIYLVPQKNNYPKSFRLQYDALTTDVDRFWEGPISIK